MKKNILFTALLEGDEKMIEKFNNEQKSFSANFLATCLGHFLALAFRFDGVSLTQFTMQQVDQKEETKTNEQAIKSN